MDFSTLFDPILAAKIVAVLGVLSAIRVAITTFGNPESSVAVWLGKIVDFFSSNVKH